MLTQWTIKLAAAGYGDIVTIKHLDVKTFFDLIHYEQYKEKWHNQYRLLNKKDK